MRSQINNKLIRITTVPESLGLFRGQPAFMSSDFDVICVSSPGHLIMATKIEEQVEVREVLMSRKITPFRDLISVWKLYVLFKKEKPLIVHSHTPKAGTLSMIASKLAGVPYRLHTVAGMPLLVEKGMKRRILDIVEKLTYYCATRVYPNSFGLADIIINQKYASHKKIKVLGNGSTNGIDTDYFDPKSIDKDAINSLKTKLAISDTDFVFIFLGRLVTDKGINELISAFKKLNTTINNIKLILLGYEEPILDPLKPETIAEIKSNGNILSLGFQKDVRPYLKIANVLTFPSYREGFPNVVMQAGAMGLPSIVTDINGCNEIIKENENGIIIPVKDAESLKLNMFLLYSNNELRHRLGINARQMIVSRYNQKDLWAEILKEYQTLENVSKSS